MRRPLPCRNEELVDRFEDNPALTAGMAGMALMRAWR